MTERYYRSREPVEAPQKALDEKLQNIAIQKIRRQIKDGEILLSNDSVLDKPYRMVRKNQLLSERLKEKGAKKTADVLERVGLGALEKAVKVAKKAHKMAKETKAVSKVAKAVGAKRVAKVADKLGYGVLDKVVKVAKKAHNMAKETKAVSKVAKAVGAKRVSKVASKLGYGKLDKVAKVAKKVYKMAKDTKAVSKVARAVGAKRVAKVADSLGFGDGDDGVFRNPSPGEGMRQGSGGFAYDPMISTNYTEVKDITRGNGGSQMSSSRYRKMRGGEEIAPTEVTIADETTGDVMDGSGVGRKIVKGLKAVNKFAKKTGIVSKGLALLGQPELATPVAMLGYGPGDSYPGYPYAHDITMGNGVLSSTKKALGKLNKFAKKTGLVSKGLRLAGQNDLADAVQTVGYGGTALTHDDQVINNINGFATSPLSYPNDPWNRGVKSNERGIGYSVDVNNFKPATMRNLYSRNAPMEDE